MSEPSRAHQLGLAMGTSMADELAAYQDERRAEIAATGEIPAEIRAAVRMRFQPGVIEEDPVDFWEGFVEGIKTTPVDKWLRPRE